jgi:anthranilate synthase component 1
MVFPSFDVFRELAQQGSLIPVYREIISDIETPVSAYLKLDTGENTFLLESAENAQRFGRYSFIGVNPKLVFSMKGRKATIMQNYQTRSYETDLDPLAELQKLMKPYKPITYGEQPLFYGGAVGYLSYESARYFEPKVQLAKKDDLNIPDACFMITEALVIFDHEEHRIKLVANAFVEGEGKDETVVKKAYEDALAKIDELAEALKKPVPHALIAPEKDPKLDAQFDVNMTHDEYIHMTEQMKEYIKAGDIFQVVPSQRFSVPYSADPIHLYRALRFINPSPYMFCLKLKGFALVGSSPETHVRCENGKVEIRPIAGTRPRKANPVEDAAMERELLTDPKERAEHVMLVDLARNDVGRVCEYHTVNVRELMVVERYSHVMHIVSHVEGTLRPEFNAYDVMRATFPAGTVTGAPKVRAMQIIAEQEPTQRASYAGAVGYFGFSGNLDSCITLRTALVKDGKVYVQAGGGLVADSTAEGEYQESLNKAKAAMKAVTLARSFS